MMMRVFVLVAACASGVLSQGAQAPPVAIVSLSSEVNPDGTFTYNYETANGIKAEARGQPAKGDKPGEEGQAIQGSFSFTADDGQQYSVTYTADENGFQPQGAHLPTPPPIPEAIQRALEYIERNPQPEQSSNRVDSFVPVPRPAQQAPFNQRRPAFGRF